VSASGSSGADPRIEPETPDPAIEAPAADAVSASAILRSIEELTAARILCLDADGRILYATAAAGLGLGIPSERLVGMTLAEMGLSPERRESFEGFWSRVTETGKPIHEVVSAGANGVQIHTEVHIAPALGPDGKVRGAVITAWDITELRAAATRIARLDRVRAILSDINQTIVRVRDRDLLLQEICRIAAEVGRLELCWIGLVEPNGDVRIAARGGSQVSILDEIVVSARAEPAGRGAIGTSIREKRTVVVADALGEDRMIPWKAQLAARGFKTAAAFPLRVHDRVIGSFALYSSQPGYFDAEEVGLFEELAADVSYALETLDSEEGKTRAEEALRDSERHYRDLFHKNPHPMWVYDVETLRFLAVNDAAMHTYGYSRDEFLAMGIRDIRPPEDVESMLASVRAPSEGYRRPGLWRHLHKDGSLIDVEISGHDAEWDGRKARVISAIDVSERRRLEAQLAEATRMEAMGHLAGGIAHDFNNLLTAVNGYAELLVAELGDSPLAEDAREISRAGARAAELTRQVLAFARRQVLAPRAVDVNDVVRGVSQMLARLIGEQVRLATTLSPEPAVVLADPGQLEQVLVNLAVNARDAMPDGGKLEIRVALVDRAEDLGHSLDGPGVLLSVSDGGSGMEEATLAHAFEPFFTTKGAGTGTGLGLATVYGIVHQSNGEVWAESKPDQGTTISVLLRRVDATPEAAHEAAPAVPRPPGLATVLVVEDEPAVRGFVASTLERAGYDVLVAGSPAEAEAMTEGTSQPIDVLVTDLVMPEINGQALAKRLLAARPSMRVILMSGYDPALTVLPADSPFRFLAKPFGRDELTSAVAQALAADQQTEHGRPPSRRRSGSSGRPAT
jgi:PAS domain S-box-containing protein